MIAWAVAAVVVVILAELLYLFLRTQPYRGQTWGRDGTRLLILKSGSYITFVNIDTGERAKEHISDFTSKYRKLR